MDGTFFKLSTSIQQQKLELYSGLVQLMCFIWQFTACAVIRLCGPSETELRYKPFFCSFSVENKTLAL